MYFWELIKAVILGIVQGITEWLPVSSTGHMILFNQFLHMNQDTDFINLFLVVIQFGSILAVVTLFFHKLNPFSPSKTTAQKRETWSMWFKVLVAEIPAGIIGLLFEDVINDYLYGPMVVAAALIIYGVLFILIENRHRTPKIDSISDVTYKTAFLIGMFQVLALIPGTSRSGSTILGAVILGASRVTAAEFSFFLAVPIMFGASLLKMVKYGFAFNGGQIGILLVGMGVAYIVSVAVIRFLMDFVRKHDFKPFGWYRIALGVVVILYFAITGAQVIA